MNSLYCYFLVALATSTACIAQIDRSWSLTDQQIDGNYKDPEAVRERGSNSQYDALSSMRQLIKNTQSTATPESIGMLGLSLRKLAMKNIFQVSERIEVYDLAQNTLLSIPGHARYFADSIEEERKKIEHIAPNTGGRLDYDRLRQWHLETLAHLPSPEAVQVLGRYLTDERDFAAMPLPPPGKNPECPTGGSAGNSRYATTALEKSELRDKPYPPKTVYDNAVAKAAWQSWWKDIEAGKKTFSFIGRNVEYRFKPDGTWETIAMASPPDDAPKVANETGNDRPNKQATPAQADSPKTIRDYSWWLFGIGGIVLVAAAGWLCRKKLT
jgi:hypothetical protein